MTAANKPFSPAADRNKEPLLEVLRELFEDSERTSVLEVGSGSGQHGVFFAQALPALQWFFSDREENHEGIGVWMKDSSLSNISGPLSYEVGKESFPKGDFDCVFTANTFHIMSWKLDKTLIKDLSVLKEGALVLVYGPFNYNDNFTSESNRQFDRMLRERDPLSGIRSFEDVKRQMELRGFRLLKDYEMPANNRLLAFQKI